MRLFVFIIFLFAVSSFGSSPEASLSIARPLGLDGSFGTETTEMICSSGSSPCTVRKISKGKVTESRTLAHDRGVQIAAQLASAMKSVASPTSKTSSPSSSQSVTMMWSVDYQGKQQQGTILARSGKTDPSLFSIMKAEAALMGESK